MASREEPIFSSGSERPDLIFSAVVIDFECAVEQEVGELLPSFMHVIKSVG